MAAIAVLIIIFIIILFIISTSNMTTERIKQPENVELVREMTQHGPNADTTSNKAIGIINTSQMNKELANQLENVEFAKELTQHDPNEDTAANEVIGIMNTSEISKELANQPENMEFAKKLTQHDPNENTTANEGIGIINTAEIYKELAYQPENVGFAKELTQNDPNEDTAANGVIVIMNTSEMSKELENQLENVEFARELTQHDLIEDTAANEAIRITNTSDINKELPNKSENVKLARELTQRDPNEDATVNEAIGIINTSEMNKELPNQSENVKFSWELTQHDPNEDTTQIKANNLNMCDQKETKTIELAHICADTEDYVLKNAVVRRKSCKFVLRLTNDKATENFNVLVPEDKLLTTELFDLSVPSAVEDGKIYISKDLIFNSSASGKKYDTLVYTKDFEVFVDDDDIIGDESYQEFELIAGRVPESIDSTELCERDSDIRMDSTDSHISWDASARCQINSITHNDDGVLVNGTVFLAKTKWNALVIEFGLGGHCAYRCVVCSEPVDTQATDDHMATEEHERRLRQRPPLPKYGENVIRHIYDIYFHCAICNIIIPNADEHIQDNYHKSQFKWALESADKLYTNLLKMHTTQISEKEENFGSASETDFNNGNSSNGPAATSNNVAHPHSGNANWNMVTDSSSVANVANPHSGNANWNMTTDSSSVASYTYNYCNWNNANHSNVHTNLAANSSNYGNYLNRLLAYYGHQSYGISNIHHYGNRGNAITVNPTNVAYYSSNIPHHNNRDNAMTASPTNVAQCSSNIHQYGNRGNEITANPTNVAQCASNIPHYGNRGNEMTVNPTNVTHCSSNIPHSGNRGNEMTANPTNVAQCGSNIPHYGNRGNEMTVNPTNIAQCGSNIPHYGNRGNEMTVNPTNVTHCSGNIPNSGNRGNEMTAHLTNVAHSSTNIPHSGNRGHEITANPTNIAQCSSNFPHYGNRGNEITTNTTNVAHSSSNIPHSGNRANEMTANLTNIAQYSTNIPHYGNMGIEMTANLSSVAQCSNFNTEANSNNSLNSNKNEEIATTSGNIAYNPNVTTRMTASSGNISHSNNSSNATNTGNEYRNIASTANPKNTTLDDIRRKAMSPDSGKNLDTDKAWKALMEKRLWRNPGHAAKYRKDNEVPLVAGSVAAFNPLYNVRADISQAVLKLKKIAIEPNETVADSDQSLSDNEEVPTVSILNRRQKCSSAASFASAETADFDQIVSDNKDTAIVKNAIKESGYLQFSSNIEHTIASPSRTFKMPETIEHVTDHWLSDNETASVASMKSDAAASAGWWDVSSEFLAGDLNRNAESDQSSDSEGTIYTDSAALNPEYPLLSISSVVKHRQTAKPSSECPTLKRKSKTDKDLVGFSYAQMAAKKDLAPQTPKRDPQKIVVNIGGQKIVLESDNFHCLTPCKGNWYCMVCIIAFTMEAKRTHKLSGEHRAKLAQCPYFENFGKHMIRQFNSAYSHCGVCNIIIQARQAEHHIKNEKHQRLTKILTAYSTAQRVRSLEEEYGPAQRQERPRGTEEGVVLKDVQVPAINVLLHVYGADLEVSVYAWQGIVMDTWGGWQRCVFCYDVLHPLMVPGHVNGLEHQTRILHFNFMKEYGSSCIRELNSKWIHCCICNRALNNERAQNAGHIEGGQHASKLRSAVVNRKNHPRWNSMFKADADKLRADAEKVLQSLNRGGTTANVSDTGKQEPNVGGRTRKQSLNRTGSSIDCDTGNTSLNTSLRSRNISESRSLSGSVASVPSVMETKSKKRSQKNGRPQSQADHREASGDDLSAPFMVTFRNRRIIIGTNSWHGIQEQPNGSLHCYLCQTPVDAEPAEHAMSLRHDSEIMATQLMETHSGHFIRELTLERSHCLTCNAVVGRSSLQAHVSDATHAARLEAAAARAHSPPDDVAHVNWDEFYDQHDPTSKMYLIKHKSESFSILVSWCWWHGLQVVDRQLRCLLCGVAVADEQRREHASSEQHSANVATCKMIETYPGHYIRQVKEKSFQCVTCNYILQVQHLKNHTQKPAHIKSLREAQFNATLPNPNAEIILYSDYCDTPQPSTANVKKSTKNKQSNKATVAVVPDAKKQHSITEKDELQDIIKEKSVKQVIKKPKKKKQPIDDKPKSKTKSKETESKDTDESKMECVSLEVVESSPVEAVCRVILPIGVDDAAPKFTRLLQYILGNNPTVKSGVGIQTPGLLIELDHSTEKEKNEKTHGRKSPEVTVTFETETSATSTQRDVKREAVEGGAQQIADVRKTCEPTETKANENESENSIASNVTVAEPKAEQENVKDSFTKVPKLKKSKANKAKSIEKESKNKDINTATTVRKVDIEQRKEMYFIHNDDSSPSLFVGWSAWHGLRRDGYKTACVVCDVTMPASETEQHTSVEVHAQLLKVATLLDRYPSVVRMLSMTAHCLTCDTIFDINAAVDHTADPQHKERLLKAQMPTHFYFIKGIISFPQYVKRQGDVLKEISNKQTAKDVGGSEKASAPSGTEEKRTVEDPKKDYVEIFDGKYPCVRVKGTIAYCIPCDMHIMTTLAADHMKTQAHADCLTATLRVVRDACSIVIQAPAELGFQLNY